MEEGLLLKEREVKRERLTWGVIGQEAKRLCYLAGPMVAVTLSQFMLQVISLMMVGHLGELSLSSTAIAISLCGVTGFSLLVSSCFFLLSPAFVDFCFERLQEHTWAVYFICLWKKKCNDKGCDYVSKCRLIMVFPKLAIKILDLSFCRFCFSFVHFFFNAHLRNSGMRFLWFIWYDNCCCE